MKKTLLTLLVSGSLISSAYAATPSAPKCSATQPEVVMVTNYGTIELQLDQTKAPISVANFEQYVKSGFYKDKIFHRVIPGFMIQGGGFDAKMNEATTKSPIKNEANNGLTNDKYTIAMARTNDPDSATAQFFINVKDNAFLNYSAGNPGYAVFGKVVKGFDVVDKIAAVPTSTAGMFENVPVKPVVIKSAKIVPCK